MPCPGQLGPQEEEQSAGPVTAVQGTWTETGPKHVAALALGGPAKAGPTCLGHLCGSQVGGCDEGGRPQARCQDTQLHP